MRALITLGLAALLLAGGCGMKGPLYLPEPAPADNQTSPSQP